MVRVRDGETLLTDGPFAETREQLGGYYMVECDTLDQAIDAARRIPGALTGRDRGAADHGVRLTEVAHDAVARAFREGYGRALAVLARALGDIDRAEDALQDASAIALERWPRDGIPATRRPGSSPPRATGPSTALRRERTRRASEAARARTLQEVADR